MARFTAKTLKGLEPILAAELLALGAEHVSPGRRVVSFAGDKEVLYKANLCLRTALNILVPIHTVELTHAGDLYPAMRQVNWSAYLRVEQTFAIKATVFSNLFAHSNFPALKLKDAIADWFRDKYGRRPSVDAARPNVLFDLHISEQTLTVSIDSSGDTLNKRGYRLHGGMAPLNEVLAAGMLIMAGWPHLGPLHVPMCGSGTLAIEAACMSAGLPANRLRKSFGFHEWPDFDPALWNRVYSDCAMPVPKATLQPTIMASDLAPDMVRLARQNATTAGVEHLISWATGDFEKCKPNTDHGLVVVNPPYGERLKEDDLMALYKRMGDFLKRSFTGFDAWILSSNAEALKSVGLKPSAKITLFNGKLESKYVKFELYRGTKKQKE
ncbi:MAG: class I SAM-dependent RNA methyltransferase [Bacteroidetes bacterium]|jgi:putative N6-adenine-specific DNA methylase|nr:class I SAM-dependent RNA methyltransferase [Bacteroidota bacterium]